jgi:rhamnose transport system permease protein
MASLAGVIYVARIGQAKADAGTGYELSAIAAVVLGGTSIFGGRGTVAGTLLGLAAIVILQTGLRLASLPAEFAGIAMGVLLIVTIALAERRSRWVWAIAGTLAAAVCAWAIVRPAPPARRITVAMMPKAKGDPYFISCRKGAEEAAKKLGVELLWDGPTDLDPAKQSEIAESWITRGVDAIAVAVANRDAIAPVLAKARARGIKVLTWDADSRPESRDAFVNQATPQAIGETLADEAARLLNGRGDFAIVTGALTAANQNEWIVHIKRRLERHPGLRLVKIVPSDDDRDRAFAETQTLIKAEPSVKLFMGIAAPAVPGAGEAVKQTGRSDLFVIGLSLPNLCKPYVRAGHVQSVVLWDTVALGRLTVESAVRLLRGETPGPEIVLGAPLIFTRANIENYDF